jgi:hypothetical protein
VAEVSNLGNLGNLGRTLGVLGTAGANAGGSVEILDDPGFDNAGAWTQGGTQFTVTGGVASDNAGVYNTDYLQQIKTLKAGRSYVFTVTIATVSAGSVQVDVVGVVTVINQAATGTYTATYTEASGAARAIRLTGTGYTGTVAYLSVRETL